MLPCTANGVDMNRSLLLTAVLSSAQGIDPSDQDIFVNVVGGTRVDEPAADLCCRGHSEQFPQLPGPRRPGDCWRGGLSGSCAARRPTGGASA